MRDSTTSGVAVFCVLMLLTSAVVLATLPATTTGSNHTRLPDDQKITVTEGVEAWERSVLPLRTDMSNAETKVPNADWYVQQDDVGEKRLNKSTLGVFTTGEDTITLYFDPSDADGVTEHFANEDVHLVAARVDPSTVDSDTSASNVSEALDLLNTTNTSSVNGNVTFYSAASTSLDGFGEATLSFTPPASGQYVFFLALNETASDGLVVDSGNLSIENETTLVGVESALVQDRASSVTLQNPDANRGDTLQFAVDNGLQGDNVTHAVLVYDEDPGFENQEFEIEVSGNPSTIDELENNTTVYHSVNKTRGVVVLEADTVLGENLSDRRVGISPGLPTLVDFVATNTSLDAPTFVYREPRHNDPHGGEVLDASLTVVNGTPDTIAVETLGNWSDANQYRWIHVAMNDDGEIETDTGTFSFGAKTPTPTPTPAQAGTGGGGGRQPGEIQVGGSGEVGAVPIGESATTSIFVTNTGDNFLGIGDVYVTGPDADQFLVTGGITFTLEGGETRELVIEVPDAQPGEAEATLVIESTDYNDPRVTVSLSYTGIEVATATESPTATPTTPPTTDTPTEPPTPPETPTTPPGPGGPGLVFWIAILVLVLGALYAAGLYYYYQTSLT